MSYGVADDGAEPRGGGDHAAVQLRIADFGMRISDLHLFFPSRFAIALCIRGQVSTFNKCKVLLWEEILNVET